MSSFLTDGTSIYIARDVAGAAQRYDQYKFDKMIYVVAAQQDLHNRQLFKMLDLMGYEWADRLEHVNFGERIRPLHMTEKKLTSFAACRDQVSFSECRPERERSNSWMRFLPKPRTACTNKWPGTPKSTLRSRTLNTRVTSSVRLPSRSRTCPPGGESCREAE